jgi:CAAX protease family protein
VERRIAVEFCVGVLIGTTAMLGIFWVESLSGLVQVTAFEPNSHHILKSASSYLVSGFLEELISRGLLLSGLILITRRPWAAIALMTAMFGFFGFCMQRIPMPPHLSVLSNAMGGVVYGVAYLGTKRLWLGTEIHFAWNFVRGAVLGFPVSGGIIPWGGLFTQSIHGPGWLTGGAYGPEGGLISILCRVGRYGSGGSLAPARTGALVFALASPHEFLALISPALRPGTSGQTISLIMDAGRCDGAPRANEQTGSYQTEFLPAILGTPPSASFEQF